jgi:hypothetical protein
MATRTNTVRMALKAAKADEARRALRRLRRAIVTSALTGAIPQRTAPELLRRAGLAEGRQ